MAVAHSILTLDEELQLFWVAFDSILAVVPLKVALGLGKIDCWAFQKNNHGHTLNIYLRDYFFKMPKNQFFHILKQLLTVSLPR